MNDTDLQRRRERHARLGPYARPPLDDSTERVGLYITLTPDLLARIDAHRGTRSRPQLVRDLIETLDP